MSFAHCHSCPCPWSQDDFWDINRYHPFRRDDIDWLIGILKDGISGKKRQLKFDSGFITDHPGIKYTKSEDGYYLIDFRDFLAMELRKKANNIERMHWPSYDDFQNDTDKTCPMCGSKYLDID